MSGHTPFTHLRDGLSDETRDRLTRPSRESVKVRAVLDPAFLDALLDEMDGMAAENANLQKLIIPLLIEAGRAGRAFNAAGLPAPGALALAAERLRNGIGLSAAELAEHERKGGVIE